MRNLIAAAVLALSAGPAAFAQDIVEVPESKAGVWFPEDIFSLPPGRWFVAKQVSQGNELCTAEACEAGFNSGDLVVTVEHAQQYVRVIAGFRGCPNVAYQELETGMQPSKRVRDELSELIRKVVKSAEKRCKVKAPTLPKLDVASLFPNQSK